jgi:hypothetical protein
MRMPDEALSSRFKAKAPEFDSLSGNGWRFTESIPSAAGDLTRPQNIPSVFRVKVDQPDRAIIYRSGGAREALPYPAS